jgi:hypothetical protein
MLGFVIGVFTGGLFGFVISAVLFADPYDN